MIIAMKIIFTFAFLLFTFYFPILSQTADKINRVRTYDVQHYVIRTKFDAKTKTVFGETTVRLKPLQDNFSVLELDAANLLFSSVKLEDSDKPLKYKLVGEKVLVTLDKAYKTDDLISVRLIYKTVKPKKGVYFVSEDKSDFNAHSKQIWSQGEPEENHFWFPSYDFPDDKASTEQYLTADKDDTVIANGELLDVKNNSNNTKTWHYKTPFVHSTYLVSFSIGKYEKVEEKYKNTPLGYYIYPSRKDLFAKSFSFTKNVFEIYENLLGFEFPFNKYDQIMVGGFDRYEGMENITATTLSDKTISLTDYDFGKPIVIDLVSHELAHSWFGNMVTCKNWSELWLNEGFATFMEAAYREKAFGKEDYLRKIREDAETYFGEESRSKQKHALFNVYAKPDDSLFDAITYQKGGAVIHTLRQEVGDEVFWKSLNIYLNRHKFANAESTDLQKVFEEVSGKKLDWFWKQWVYGIGYPKLSVTPSFDETTKTLKLIFKQNQPENEFRLPLDVKFQTEKGNQTEKILIENKTQTFTFNLDSKPIGLNFDKDEKIPLKSLSVAELVMTKSETAR
jgi:aminopeptidase N